MRGGGLERQTAGDGFLNASDGRGAQGGSPVARRGSRPRAANRGPLEAEPGVTHEDVADLARGDWGALLRDERLRLRMTQADVARMVSISTIALRKYEASDRTPSRETLGSILVALQVPQIRARRIMEAAGYGSIGRLLSASHPDFYYTLEEARVAMEQVPWPRWVANNVMELVAANRATREFCRFDLAREEPKRRRIQLNFITLLSEHWLSDYVANMDEMRAMVIGVLKGMPRGGGGRLDKPNPVTRAVIEEFSANEPHNLPRLLEMLETIPAQDSKVSWWYPMIWDEPGIGRISFHCTVTDASESDAFAFNDWIPADGESHLRLERTLEARRRELAARKIRR